MDGKNRVQEINQEIDHCTSKQSHQAPHVHEEHHVGDFFFGVDRCSNSSNICKLASLLPFSKILSILTCLPCHRILNLSLYEIWLYVNVRVSSWDLLTSIQQLCLRIRKLCILSISSVHPFYWLELIRFASFGHCLRIISILRVHSL